MPTYIYRIQPVRPEMLSAGATEEESRIAGEHFAYLKALMEDGVLILAGRTLNNDYSAFGIAIFNARDDEHMRQITAGDPGVAKKLFRAEWHPYRIALHAPENSGRE
ncbi:MAG: YciI family protein [Chloroflexi bacterium]|nr:YciI family protein [Chloroflexota bacterium]